MISFIGRNKKANLLLALYKISACIIFCLFFTLSARAQQGNSLNLDGSNDKIEINDSNSLDLLGSGSYTLECWIKPESFNFLGGLIGKYHAPGANGYTLRLSSTSPYTGLNFDELQTANGILQAGKWYHVAAVNNNGTRKLYLNGVEQTLTGSTFSVVANTNKLKLGVDYDTGNPGDSRYFDGNIDEVRIWNVARTQTEIQTSMNIPVSSSSTGLVAYYNFNTGTAGGSNGSATTLADQTTNANTGTLVNFALTGSTSNWVSSLAFNPPAITNISPSFGVPGSSITLTGSGFNAIAANNIVYFGPVKATVTAASATSLTVTVPAGAAYSQINVLNTGNSFSGTSTKFFTPVFSPNKPGLIAADITFQGNIEPSPPYTPPYTPPYPRVYSLGARDLDNDGKPELVMTSGDVGDNKVHVRTNTSAAASTISFSSVVTFTVAGGLSRADGQISFGDLDGDTRPDVVVPGGDADAFAILRNNGGTINSSFFTATTVSSASRPTGSAVSDLDLDGKPDIVITNYLSSQIRAYPNTTVTQGSIVVGAGITMTGSGFQTTQVVTADLDGDGKPEIIAPQTTSNVIHFFQNTSTPGSISFGSRQSKDVHVDISHNASFIVAGDLNNDGKPDMVVTDGASDATSIAILRNTSTIGSITFSATTQQIGTAYSQGSAAFADMNGDGKPDLILGMEKDFDPDPTPGAYDFRIAVLYNTSVGDNISFSSPIEYVSGTTALGYSVIATDMNADGVPDILVPGGNSGYTRMYRGSPQFPPTISSFSPLSAVPGSSVVISGTGFNSTISNNTVFFGTVKGTVTAASTTSLTVTVPVNASYGPISVLNLANTLSASSSRFFTPAFAPNKPTLATTDFVQQTDFSVTGELYGLAAGDLTGDGKPELVVTNSKSAGSLIILPNTSSTGGTVSFGAATTITPSSNFDRPAYVSLADLDGNGWLDIAVPSYNSSKVGVFLNSGTGTLSTSFTATPLSFATDSLSPPLIPPTGGPIGVATGDLDGDGKPDIVTSNNRAQSVSVFRNTSTNINTVSFAAKQDYDISATDAVYNMTLADMDNDGKLDIITGRDINGDPGKVVFLRNTSTVGSISFAAAVEIAGPNAPWGFVPGDLNGDGLTDLVVGAAGGSATEIFAYTKTSSGGALTNLSTTKLNVTGDNIAIGLADLNGDGKPDVISGKRSQEPGAGPNFVFNSYIYPNTTTGTTTSFGTRLDLPISPSQVKPWNTVTTDMNGDGKPDIIMGRQGSITSRITVFRNTLIAPPVTQALNTVVSNLTAASTTLTWTNGSGEKRAVFVKADNTGTPTPVNGTAYTASTIFGSGSQIGSTGWYCIFNGTGNTVNITGLSPSVTYRSMVVEYNDGGLSATQQYQTATATNNPVNFTPLSTLTSIVKAGTSPTNSATLSYTVTFTTSVSGLSASNFSLTTSGLTGTSVTGVSGSGTTHTVTVNTGSGNGTLRLNLANTTGMTPGVTNTLPFAGEVYTIDKTPPALNSVTVPANGTYGKSQDLDFTVNFSENMTANTSGGVPYISLTLNTGGTVQAAYAAGNGTSSLIFRYTVANGNVDNDGVVLGSSIVLNGGTVKDLAGNDAPTTLNSVGSTTSIFVDFNALSVTSIMRKSPAQVTTNATSLVFTVTFSQNVTGVDASDFLFFAPEATGNIASVTPVSASVYDITVNSISGNGLARLDLKTSGTGITGNTTITGGFSGGEAYTLDQAPPTLSPVSVVSNNSNTNYAKTGNVITLTFTANEAITTPTVTIATHAVTASNSSGNNWTTSYTMIGSDAEGIIPFNISFADVLGNNGTAVTASTNSSSVIFDKTIPSLSSVDITSNNSTSSKAKTGDIITLNFTSSEPILTPSVTIATNSVTAINSSGNNWTSSYTMSSSDAEGVVPFSIAFNDLTGNAGTTVAVTTNGSSVIFDRTAPVLSNVSIASNNSNTSKAKTGNAVTLNFTVSETIGTPAVTIAGNNVAATNSSGNNWTSSYTITSNDAEGVVPFNIAFSDLTGNNGSSVTGTTNSSSVSVIRTDLVSLTLSSGTLSPVFTPATTTYTTSVTNIGSLTVTPVADDASSTITVNGSAISPGSSGTVSLNLGSNAIVVIVTSPDAITTKTYILTVTRLKADQTITFAAISPKLLGDPDFDPGATASSGLSVSYSSDNSAVATIVSGKIHLVGFGTAVITASQAGDAISYNAAPSITRTLSATGGAPNDISFTQSTIYENLATGSQVGIFSSSSTDPNSTFIYSLVSGTGSTDNLLFSISGDKLLIAGNLDYEQKSNYSIRVRSSTQYGFSTDKQFTVTVNDVNEAPTLAAITNQVICYATNTFNISLTATAGPETGQTTTLTVSTDKPTMFAQLSISGSILSYRLNAGVTGVATIIVTVKDNGGTANGGVDTSTRVFTITVNALPVASIVSDLGMDISKGFTAKLAASGGVTYSWATAAGIISGQNTAVLTVRPSVTTTYTVTVTNGSGCVSIQSITLNVLEDYVALNPNNILTPNGDGKNDTWVVKNIDMYPNNMVKVFDRAGRLIFNKRGYTNDWGGTLQGGILSEDTYYYIVDFGDGTGELRGYISIVK